MCNSMFHLINIEEEIHEKEREKERERQTDRQTEREDWEVSEKQIRDINITEINHNLNLDAG